MTMEEPMSEWSVDDLKILFNRVPLGRPVTTSKSHPQRSLWAAYRQLDWEKIKFGDFTAVECQLKFVKSRELVYKRMPMEFDLDVMQKMCEAQPDIFQRPTRVRNIGSTSLYFRENFAKIKAKHPGVKTGPEVLRLAMKKWKKLSSEKRKVYEDRAAAANKVLDDQNEVVTADPFKDIPPLPQSALDLYIETTREDFVDENLSEKKLRKKLSKKFAKLDEAEKKPWQKAAKKEAKQFLEELKAFKVANPKLAIAIPQIGDLIDGTVGAVALAPPKTVSKYYNLYTFCSKRLWAEHDKPIHQNSMFGYLKEMYKQLSPDALAVYKEEFQQFRENYSQQVSAYLDAIADPNFQAAEKCRLLSSKDRRKGKRRLSNGDTDDSTVANRSVTEVVGLKSKKRKMKADE